MNVTHSVEELAESYLGAVDQLTAAVRGVSVAAADWRKDDSSWSVRDIAFHVADVDQLLGIRLRRIVGEDYPALAGVDAQASVRQLRSVRMDLGLALDSLGATSALNVALMESLNAEQLLRKGRHSQGHDVTAADVCAFLSIHIEAHVRQIARVQKASQG